MSDKTALELIAAERQRQIEVEGWTAEHDDQEHEPGDLARAAACYAAGEPIFRQGYGCIDGNERLPQAWFSNLWPWGGRWYKPKDRKRDLIRAGALILAELDRLLREEGGKGGE